MADFTMELREGIIPARAGSTNTDLLREIRDKDHPRSRGVYTYPYMMFELTTGSSPLARGLRGADDVGPVG